MKKELLANPHNIIEPDLDELLDHYSPLKFTYPLFLKLLFGLGGSILFVLPILSMATRDLRLEALTEILSAAFVSCLGLLGLFGAYCLTGNITVTDEGLTWSRFGFHRSLEFEQIQHIQNRKVMGSLILEGNQTSIRIEKQLNYYGLLYDIILHKMQPLAPDPGKLAFPVMIKSKKGHYWWMGMILLMSLFLSVQMGLSYFYSSSTLGCPPDTQSQSDVFMLLFFPFLTLTWLLLCAVGVFHLVHRVELWPQSIVISNLFRRIELPVAALSGVIVQKKYVAGEDPCYDLELRFDEQEVARLQRTWGTLPRYFWRHLTNLYELKESKVILLEGNNFNVDMKSVYNFMTQNYLQRDLTGLEH